MSFQRKKWRLIYHPASCGAWNMAVDEAILEAVGRNQALPTLRLYAWTPPCLSLGHAQPVADVLLDALKEHGWDLVRRPTGGRAILHVDELTYSVCAPTQDPRLEGGVLRSYRVISRALLRALTLLGIEVEAREEPREEPRPNSREGDKASIHIPNPVCFEEPSNYEITAGGKKLIGSAQARRKDAVLQHGSLPLYGDITRIIQVLSFPDESEREEASYRLLSHAVSVEQILGKRITWEATAQAFVAAFSQTLNLEFQAEDLTSSEISRAETLRNEKYSNWNWTGRV